MNHQSPKVVPTRVPAPAPVPVAQSVSAPVPNARPRRQTKPLEVQNPVAPPAPIAR